MRNRRLAALTVLGGVLVWLGAGELPWPARSLVLFLLVPLPVAMVAQLALLEDVPDDPPRQALYLSSGLAIGVLAAVALLAARTSGFTPRLLGLFRPPWGVLLAWSAAATLAAVAVLAAARALGARESPIIARLLPRSPGERAGFAALSLSAGIGEELVYRGFLLPAVTAASGSRWLAVAVTAAAFGIVHVYQGRDGALRATALGLLLTVPVLASGSILPSMVAHTAIDLLAGLVLADWLLRRNPVER